MKNIKVDFRILFIIILYIYLSNKNVKYENSTSLENKWSDIELNFNK